MGALRVGKVDDSSIQFEDSARMRLLFRHTNDPRKGVLAGVNAARKERYGRAARPVGAAPVRIQMESQSSCLV